MASILALDQGTTGSTALVIHQEGQVLARAYREFTQHFPRPGWVEHDPNEILDVTIDAAREALASAGEVPAGIGITNQRETVVVWDRATLDPLAQAIVWQDRRTADTCQALRASGVEPQVRERTGLLLDPYFSATKLAWLLEHDAALRTRAVRGEVAAGTIDSWLIARLTGGRRHATDHTNASRTLLYNIQARDWDPEQLSLFGIPPEILPDIVPSSGIIGESASSVFGSALPIAGVAGDQQAALYGQGCVTPGLAKNTYGTGAFLLLNTGRERAVSSHGLLTTIACDGSGQPCYALEGSVFIAGAAVQWLRDGLGLLASAAESEDLARSVTDTGGVHFVPAFVGLGSPHWEPAARGTITGLTRGTTAAHLVRAALEAMAFSSRDLLQAMTNDAGIDIPALRVDGGAVANSWLMQFQADVLGIAVERPDMIETTAAGAAALAGLALGVWPNIDAFLEGRRFTRFEPSLDTEARSRLSAEWDRAIRTTLSWARAD